MGTCHSSCGDSICDCFAHDAKIKTLKTIRYSTRKWQWNKHHELALNQSISEICALYDIQMPYPIISIIKDLSYKSTEIYYITYPVIQIEKYYSKYTHLMNKNLCKSWYLSIGQNIDSLLISLHVSGWVIFFVYFNLDI